VACPWPDYTGRPPSGRHAAWGQVRGDGDTAREVARHGVPVDPVPVADSGVAHQSGQERKGEQVQQSVEKKGGHVGECMVLAEVRVSNHVREGKIYKIP
jgi:hypothetical protein